MVRGKRQAPAPDRDAQRPARRSPRRVALPLAPTEPLPAGSFSEWLRALRRARQEQRDVDVPCGECTACCRSSLFILITPEERETLARIDPALLFPVPGAPPGHVLMGYDRDGRCPLLGPSGCTIYEHRPRTCRDFDCRTVAATAIALDQAQHAIAEQARRWRFDHPAAEDGQQQAAVRAAAAFLVERAPELLPEALPAQPLQLAMLALRVFELFQRLEKQPHDERPTDTQLARAILAAMAGHAADTQPARATSVKRAARARP